MPRATGSSGLNRWGDQQRNRSPIARKPRYVVIAMTTVKAIANNGHNDAKI